MKYKIVEYRFTEQVRDWGSCQENDQSESAYYTQHKIGYKVVNTKGETIYEGGENKIWAENYIKTELNPKWKKEQKRIKKLELKNKIKILQAELKALK